MKHILDALSENPHAPMEELFVRRRNQRKRAREGPTTSPIYPSHHPFAAVTYFSLRIRVGDVINPAKFSPESVQSYRLQISRGRKSVSTDFRYRR